ncbi:MAG: hypothetical protein HC809_16565 [Gammaproteobacteria bacterium]|nr:hypothetical protein [Gammaproteobacteria bacterium]
MQELEDLKDHVAALERHVAHLEGVLAVLLEEIAAGRIFESAAGILAEFRPRG